MNKTAIRSYLISNDRNGKIIKKLVNVIPNKEKRSKEMCKDAKE